MARVGVLWHPRLVHVHAYGGAVRIAGPASSVAVRGC